MPGASSWHPPWDIWRTDQDGTLHSGVSREAGKRSDERKQPRVLNPKASGLSNLT